LNCALADTQRLHVTWPGCLATHSTEQTLYAGHDGLFRRHDYDIEIAGNIAVALRTRGQGGR